MLAVRVRVALDSTKALPGEMVLHLRSERLESLDLAREHVSFHELHHAYPQAVPDRSEDHPTRGSGLALPLTGNDHYQTDTLFRFQWLKIHFALGRSLQGQRADLWTPDHTYKIRLPEAVSITDRRPLARRALKLPNPQVRSDSRATGTREKD